MDKFCIHCKQNKNIKEFYSNSGHSDGLDSFCKKCSSIKHKEYYKKNILIEREKRKERNKIFRNKYPDLNKNYKLKHRYGITLEEKEEKIREQENRCAICNQFFEGRICVDHNHKTGQVRAILCNSCNAGLGYFGENIENLQNAIDYLISWKES